MYKFVFSRRNVQNHRKCRKREDEADANEVLLEELKRQERVMTMYLTKLYTRLMRLMPDETIDREAILIALENVEEKKMDAI